MKKEFKTMQELFESAKRWTKEFYARETSKEPGCLFMQAILTYPGKYSCFCLLGGAIKVYEDYDKYDEVKEKLEKVIKKYYPRRWKSGICVPSFNDHPKTTIEDIRRVVKLANV
jgi:hypothetical protein